MEEKIFFSKHKAIFKITLIAVLSSLNFVIMLIPKIPIPSLVGHPYVHFGNLIVMISSIFFGGLVGGLSGSIGMGIYDLVSGYGIWTLKTVILKFGIGIVTGIAYKLVRNRNNKRLQNEMVCVGALFFLLSICTFSLSYIQNGSFVINDIKIDIPWPLYVFTFVLGLLLILSGILSSRDKIQKVMYAAAIGVVFNIVGELFGGFLKKLLTGEGMKVSIAMSIASIPATIINGCVAIFVLFIIFPGLNKALNKIKMDDNLSE